MGVQYAKKGTERRGSLNRLSDILGVRTPNCASQKQKLCPSHVYHFTIALPSRASPVHLCEIVAWNNLQVFSQHPLLALRPNVIKCPYTVIVIS